MLCCVPVPGYGTTKANAPQHAHYLSHLGLMLLSKEGNWHAEANLRVGESPVVTLMLLGVLPEPVQERIELGALHQLLVNWDVGLAHLCKGLIEALIHLSAQTCISESGQFAGLNRTPASRSMSKQGLGYHAQAFAYNDWPFLQALHVPGSYCLWRDAPYRTTHTPPHHRG